MHTALLFVVCSVGNFAAAFAFALQSGAIGWRRLLRISGLLAVVQSLAFLAGWLPGKQACYGDFWSHWLTCAALPAVGCYLGYKAIADVRRTLRVSTCWRQVVLFAVVVLVTGMSSFGQGQYFGEDKLGVYSLVGLLSLAAFGFSAAGLALGSRVGRLSMVGAPIFSAVMFVFLGGLELVRFY